MINTMAEANALLASYIPRKRELSYSLDRMVRLLDKLGNPQEQFKTVHIAGTSGKTSTTYFIRGLLEASGYRTGLTISPHIDSVTERIQIGSQPLSDEKFVGYVNDVLGKLGDIEPSYFEFLIAVAYAAFAAEGIDYAVVETGLGGLLDATNTIRRSDKLAVITNIGLDHTEILGNTVEAIAAQKAGIIQAGNAALVQHQAASVETVIQDVASQRGGSVTIIDQPVNLPELPLFQRLNWAMARAAYQFLAARDQLRPLPELRPPQILALQPPGRMEIHQVAGKTIILDGAHNPQKLTALRDALAERGLHSLPTMANFVPAPAEKLTDSLATLATFASQLIIPDFSIVRDVGRDFQPAAAICEQAQASGLPVKIVPELAAALQQLLALPDSTVLVTGSLYLVAQVRHLLQTNQ